MDTTTTIEEAFEAYQRSWGDTRALIAKEFRKRYGQTVSAYVTAVRRARWEAEAAKPETKADQWKTEDLDQLAQEIVAGGHAAALIRLVEHHRQVQPVAKRCGNWDCDNRIASARMAYCSAACRQKAYRDRLRLEAQA